MVAKRRAVVIGETRGRAAVSTVCRELDEAIRNLGLSYRAIGRDVGLSDSQVGRIARGLSPDLSIMQASRLLATVGLELSVRSFPSGRPLRDQAHLDLLARLRARLHSSLSWRTEVPVAANGDLRAWDAVIAGDGWSAGVEAETRVRDVQAIERRINLKVRDGSVDTVILLAAATRHNRTLLRSEGSALREAFPLPGQRALELLRAGVNPGGSCLMLL